VISGAVSTYGNRYLDGSNHVQLQWSARYGYDWGPIRGGRRCPGEPPRRRMVVSVTMSSWIGTGSDPRAFRSPYAGELPEKLREYPSFVVVDETGCRQATHGGRDR
jgi:hypothetical protein